MSLDGVWKSRGYGWILKIDSASYALFDFTRLACVEIERGSIGEFEAGFELLTRDDSDHLALRIRNDLSRYDFDRVPSLPREVLFLDCERQSDVGLNFEYFCEVFSQDYAFFDLRGVDWQQLCNRARGRILGGCSPDGLFGVLNDLIQPLQDNHVTLSDGVRTVNSEKLADIKALVQASLGLRSGSMGDPFNLSRVSEFINREFLGGKAKLAGNAAVLWGNIAPGVGYLNVLRLFGLANTDRGRTASDLPPRRPDHASFLREDLDAVESIFNQAMSDLSETRAIIFDVRLNGGGFDTVGMSIANRFADRRRLAFTKQTRQGSGLTPLQEFHIEPVKGAAYTRPVYLLTSARTASAGDIFALCMRSIPHVTLVGQPSTGILSDNLKKHLPNGWMTSISNELYGSPDGLLFEGPGVPVDVETPVYVSEDFRGGYHLAVDKALQLASQSM